MDFQGRSREQSRWGVEYLAAIGDQVVLICRDARGVARFELRCALADWDEDLMDRLEELLDLRYPDPEPDPLGDALGLAAPDSLPRRRLPPPSEFRRRGWRRP